MPGMATQRHSGKEITRMDWSLLTEKNAGKNEMLTRTNLSAISRASVAVSEQGRGAV